MRQGIPPYLILIGIALLFTNCVSNKDHRNPFDPDLSETVARLKKLPQKSPDPYIQKICKDGVELLEDAYQFEDFVSPVPNGGTLTFIMSTHVDKGFGSDKVIPCKNQILNHLDTNRYDCIFAEGFALPPGTKPSIEAITLANMQADKERWASVYKTPDTFNIEFYRRIVTRNLPREAYWLWDYLEKHPNATVYGYDDLTLIYCIHIARQYGEYEFIQLVANTHFNRTLVEAYKKASEGNSVAIIWGPGHTIDCELFTQRTGVPITILSLPSCQTPQTQTTLKN